jgi:hypothetical protein
VAVSLTVYDMKNADVINTEARWLVSSRRYKEIMERSGSPTGELKHLVWDSSGFAGVANNTVYLVFDPSDSLLPAARSHLPGKYNGIPCKVRFVHRLESHWYTVPFYTDEEWGQLGRLDCR